jgi:hypothetical protein
MSMAISETRTMKTEMARRSGYYLSSPVNFTNIFAVFKIWYWQMMIKKNRVVLRASAMTLMSRSLGCLDRLLRKLFFNMM